AMTQSITSLCNINVIKKPLEFRPDGTSAHVDVAIALSVLSENSLSSMAIIFKKEVFLKIIGKMLGETFTDYSNELHDAAKELINIAFNAAKKKMVEKKINGVRSNPEVWFGNQVELSYLSRARTVILPFDTDLGSFSIEFTTQEVTVSDRI
ncbi:MAG: chemotaxis protein CheX, partial [Deltaproteobacteria bacterium]